MSMRKPLLLAVAALGYQILFHLDAAPRYLRDAQPEDLPWLLPVTAP